VETPTRIAGLAHAARRAFSPSSARELYALCHSAWRPMPSTCAIGLQRSTIALSYRAGGGKQSLVDCPRGRSMPNGGRAGRAFHLLEIAATCLASPQMAPNCHARAQRRGVLLLIGRRRSCRDKLAMSPIPRGGRVRFFRVTRYQVVHYA
jgi:hypothetical protein